MKKLPDIGDDEIRVLGSKPSLFSKWWFWTLIAVAVIAIIAILFFRMKPQPQPLPVVLPATAEETLAPDIWHNNADADMPSCVAVTDTLVDSLRLRIFTPYNTFPELHVGRLDTSDTQILFAAMAADLRRDNGNLVGAYVLAGEPLSWGLSKRGYCAIIDDQLALGVAENSPLFEQATERGGYFFRQYPAVLQGRPVLNNPQNASFRRALCLLDGKVCIITSSDRVLMNDFSSTLAKLGVSDAIYLVGGSVHGWYRDSQGRAHLLGQDLRNAKNINYILFRKQ